MKKLILAVMIFLIIGGVIPLHELSHIIMAKTLGGEVRDISWFSFSKITDSQGEYYWGWVYIENIPYNWKWVLVVLAGGMFQGLLYMTTGFIGLVLSNRRFLRSEKKAFGIISLACFILGILGLFTGVYELWIANQGIYP